MCQSQDPNPGQCVSYGYKTTPYQHNADAHSGGGYVYAHFKLTFIKIYSEEKYIFLHLQINLDFSNLENYSSHVSSQIDALNF